jgi:hypothetical protein
LRRVAPSVLAVLLIGVKPSIEAARAIKMGGTINIGGIVDPSRRAAPTSLMPGGVVKRGSVVCRGSAIGRGGPIETSGVVKKGPVVKRGGPTWKSRRSLLVAPQQQLLKDVPRQRRSHQRHRWTRGAGE